MSETPQPKPMPGVPELTAEDLLQALEEQGETQSARLLRDVCYGSGQPVSTFDSAL